MLLRRSLFSLLIVLSLTLFSACTDKKSSDNNSGGDTPPPIIDPNPPVPEGILNENMKLIDGVYIYKNTLYQDSMITAHSTSQNIDTTSPSLLFSAFNYSTADIPAGKLELEITDNSENVFIQPFGAGNCEAGIKAGAQCDFQIYLDESKIKTVGLKEAKLKITINGKSDNFTLSVNAKTTSDQSVLFEYKNQTSPIYPLDKTMAQATKLTIYARTDKPFTIESVSVANEDESFIEINNSEDCIDATLVHGQTADCSVPFNITPKKVGVSMATITVKIKDGSEHKVPVYIEAIAGAVLSTAFEATNPAGNTAITLGLVNNIGKVPATELMTATIYIRNESANDIAGIVFGEFKGVNGMAIVGGAPLDACTTLAKGAECVFNITLDDAKYGEQKASMDFTHNGVTKTMTFIAEVVPALFDFDLLQDNELYTKMLEVGTQFQITLKLHGANKNVEYITSLPAGYTLVSNICNGTLRANSECKITFNYTTTEAGGFKLGLNKHLLTVKIAGHDMTTYSLINATP